MCRGRSCLTSLGVLDEDSSSNGTRLYQCIRILQYFVMKIDTFRMASSKHTDTMLQPLPCAVVAVLWAITVAHAEEIVNTSTFTIICNACGMIFMLNKRNRILSDTARGFTGGVRVGIVSHTRQTDGSEHSLHEDALFLGCHVTNIPI